MNADIFISYSTLDRPHALTLVERLRSSGYEIWIDQSGIDAATSWSKEIAEALEDCSTFILLLSPNSLASENVAKELAVAAELKKHIIPIELESVQLKREFLYHLTGLQRVAHTNIDAIVHVLEKYQGSGQLPVASGQLDARREQIVSDMTIRIAVLPFEDQSPAHDNEWFSDGLTDELISMLNKLDALFVLDRKSSKIYKDAKMTVKQIAHELNVRYIVTGAVRKAGEKLRIQASLIEASSGATLWDEKFNGTMDDIFEIQEKTALDICEGLKLKLTPQEEQMLDEKLTNSPEAYELYLQARNRGNHFGDHHGAIELCEKALAHDPNFIPVYGSMAIYISNIYRQDKTQTHLVARVKQTIAKMMELDPKSPYLYPPRANYYLNIGENELALEMAEKAVETLPKRWGSWAVLAFILDVLGDYKGAIAAYDKAHEIDPTYVGYYYAKILSSFIVGDHQKVLIEWDKGDSLMAKRIEEHPDVMGFRIEYMVAADIAGHPEISVPIARSLVTMKEVTFMMHYEAGGIFARNGFFEDGAKHLRAAIDAGLDEFNNLDRIWYANLQGTPEYDFLVEHIV